MPIALLVATLISSLKNQEVAFATAELRSVIVSENNRVSAQISDTDIDTAIRVITTLGYAEQTALVGALTAKLGVK